MNKLKRFIAPVTVAFMALCLPLLVHASDNSITILPGEGNVQCNDYSVNKGTFSMLPDSSTTLSGPDNPNDGNDADGGADEIAYYSMNADATILEFNSSSTPIDFAVIKSSKYVSTLIYASGGVDSDANMTVTVDGVDLEISAFSLCYGLGNEPAPPPPENLPPVLDPIGDKEVTEGNDLMFTVNATDDDLPTPPLLTITHSTLPAGASFTDNGDGTGYFEWLGASPAGSTNVTFTVSDGALIDTETITITVNEIPTEPLATPSCEAIQSVLDKTGVTCPTDGTRALVCNIELDVSTFGTANNSDVCCICNNVTGLEQCDPAAPPGTTGTTGLRSCTMTVAEKQALIDAGTPLLPAEISTHIEINNDPYYCLTSLGTRTCYWYQ